MVLNVEEEKGAKFLHEVEPARCPIVCELSVLARSTRILGGVLMTSSRALDLSLHHPKNHMQTSGHSESHALDNQLASINGGMLL